MSVLEKLATSLSRRDEAPNQELAREIAATGNTAAVTELVQLLKGKDKNLQNDAIKTLYETSFINPELIAEHWPVFIEMLKGKNNRLIWGSMIALSEITNVKPDDIFVNLPVILQAADAGSVITRDGAVAILTKLAGNEQYSKTAFPLLMEQMQQCPPNQFPMYAENAMTVISVKNKPGFVGLLKERLPDLPKESQKKRVEKVLKKLNT